MTKRKGSEEVPLGELRRRAEEKAEAGDCACFKIGEKDPIALVHELEVHRIELEMQNEELRRSQREAHDLYERFLDLYDFAPVCYLTLDAYGKIIEANITAATYLGFERKSLINSQFTLYLRHHAWKPFNNFIGEVMTAAGKLRCELDLIKNKKAIIEGVAVSNGTGAPRQVRLALTDITDLRRTEASLKKLNDELEQKVRERTTELREKDRMLILQSRQAAMGEMIGNISHQWRQPLNALGLMVQSLLYLDDAGGLKRDVLETSVHEVMEIITHMSATIDDFRSYFRPDRDRVPFHLDHAVTRTIGLIGANFRDRGINITTVKNGDPLVTGFPNEFSQALLNILVNARDVFEERGVAGPRVVIGVGEETGMGVVTIADNAGGIEKEVLDKVFEPYFTTKSPDKGTGVGLFMAKSIIERNMGGRLTVRNTDSGAEFRIELKLS
ncbi:MAG TPA: PAS domain-containing sensor histidine kinase [Geobacteraceae bacterium]|nr:PAS domain-containing sensor histidine kinase [Geobacteraceae bacterium]